MPHRDVQLDLFGALPPHRQTDTSVAAAVAIAPKVPELRARVLAELLQRGRRGATDHELCAALGLIKDTVAPRRTELRDDGLVVDSGRRRRTPSGRSAIVWVAVECAT